MPLVSSPAADAEPSPARPARRARDARRWRARYGPWAVVTGASSGIGRAIAHELAAAGQHLVLVARGRAALDALAADLADRYGRQTRVVALDLAADDAAAELDAATADLDVGLLVAAAGFGTSGPFLAGNLADERAMLRVNAGAVHELALRFGRRLAARGGGGVVLLSSIVGFQGAPYAAHYAATKAYVQALAEALRVEWAPLGIDVLASAPGPTHSGFAARAGMRMGAALAPATVARDALAALGRRATARPGLLTKALTYALATLPRAARVRVMGRVMRGMTGHAPLARAAATTAAALLLAAAGCAAPDARADDGARAEPAAAAGAEPPPVPVRVAPAALAERDAEVRASGVVEARASSELAFQVGGRVARVLVDEGTAVPAGALLAALDPTDYALALRQAELARDRAADELRRAEPLRAAGSIAANDFDRLENAARQAAVARDLAAKRLADARLAAPFAGVIARKATEVGATASPGTAVLTLVALDTVRVRVGVPEQEVGALRAGQPARVELEALGRAVEGRVRFVNVAADPASRTYAVQVAVPNPGGLLRAGMVASVAVRTGARRPAVAVPASAVARDADGATLVYVPAPPGAGGAAGVTRVRARRVEVGAALGDRVEVARGLAAGEPVVVAGQERLRDGARVTAVAAPPAPNGVEGRP